MNKQMIRLAIHHRTRSFSDRWLEYCSERNIDVKLVRATDSGIIDSLADCDAFLWQPSHALPTDMLLAAELAAALDSTGKPIYPNRATVWHFDDKLAQKYLLESLNAPFVPTTVFFDSESAHRWAKAAEFPKVFKLRRGAGSSNVRLVSSARQAHSLIRRAFGSGFKPLASPLSDLGVKARRHRTAADRVRVIGRLPGLLWRMWNNSRLTARENGYVYFQEFMPGNSFDTRITIIGERAFGFTRDVRRNDFRASGSGAISYDHSRIDMEAVNIAYDVADRIGSQSLAFDFVKDSSGQPVIIEISFGFATLPVFNCGGYWDRNLNWHSGSIWPQDAIMEDLLAQITSERLVT